MTGCHIRGKIQHGNRIMGQKHTPSNGNRCVGHCYAPSRYHSRSRWVQKWVFLGPPWPREYLGESLYQCYFPCKQENMLFFSSRLIFQAGHLIIYKCIAESSQTLWLRKWGIVIRVAPVCVNSSVHTWPWGRLFLGITLPTQRGEAWEGRWWAF